MKEKIKYFDKKDITTRAITVKLYGRYNKDETTLDIDLLSDCTKEDLKRIIFALYKDLNKG